MESHTMMIRNTDPARMTIGGIWSNLLKLSKRLDALETPQPSPRVVASKRFAHYEATGDIATQDEITETEHRRKIRDLETRNAELQLKLTNLRNVMVYKNQKINALESNE